MYRPIIVAIPSIAPARFLLGRVTGADEAGLARGRPGEATQLLAALLLTADGAAVDVTRLPMPVHDRLLGEVFRTEFGDRAECQAACTSCGEAFEFALSLEGLTGAQDRDAAAIGLANGDGYWPCGDHLVRAPLLRDAVAGDEADLLAAVCVPPPETGEAAAAVTAFLERAAPLLSQDLDAQCPHCGADQKLAFDLPRFLVAALANEQAFLVRETHLIASRYGWSHAEILALPRDRRRAFAGLIESERSAALRQRRAG